MAAATDTRSLAGSVGVLMDRLSGRDEPLGTIWLAEPGKAATCAHLVVLYQDCLSALKVCFPANGEERGVESASFQPKFDLKLAEQMARKSLSAPVTGLPLLDNNLVVLSLSANLPQVSADLAAAVNRKLAAPAPPRDKGLSGDLSDIDLAFIIQTITSARKEGTLVISDERNHPIARLFCRDGKILHARCGSLVNEEAVYHIVSQNLTGQFYFQSQKSPDWPAASTIARPTDMLLIEAHRRVDEIPKLLLDLGGDASVFTRANETLSLDKIPEESHATAQILWPLLSGTTPTGRLWRLAHTDDYSLFTALCHLKQSGQIAEAGPPDPLNAYRAAPLETAPEAPLTPWDEIQCLTVDPVSGLPSAASGHLLGSARPGDPWHLIHDLPLSPEAAGAPVLKEGKVIGIHCGGLPSGTGATTAMKNLQQMLWVEALRPCVSTAASGNGQQEASTVGGCTEVAQLDCPKCGHRTLGSARFCKSCGQRLLADTDFHERRALSWKPLAALAALLLLLGAGLAWIANHPPAPTPTAPPPVIPAAQSRVAVEIEKADPSRGRWISAPAGSVFQNGDVIRIRLQPAATSYVYVLHQGTTSDDVDIIYPFSPKADVAHPAGTWISIPPEPEGDAAGGAVALHGLTIYGKPGAEKLVVLAGDSRSDLLEKPQELAHVFREARAMLKRMPSATGLEASPQALGSTVFVQNSNGQGGKLFLTGVDITHSDRP